MKPLQPVFTAHLFPELHAELMSLLGALSPEDWGRPTVARQWAVRDVVAHLLDGDLRKLSFHRDGLTPPSPGAGDLVAFLNALNAEWVQASRRLSPRVLVNLLGGSGPQVSAFVAGLDPFGRALFGVAWAGETESQNWMDTGREYTERWHHQQQVRMAVGATLLRSPQWLRPVLEVSVRALPHAYRNVPVREGTTIAFEVTGGAGDTWTLAGREGRWRLFAGPSPKPAARITLSEDLAWRLFLKAATRAEAEGGTTLDGDRGLAGAALDALAVMA